jgi:hypothetical protein
MMFLALLLSAAAPQSCGYDRAVLMALDEDSFDQNPKGGWRSLSDRKCYAEAADLVRAYREAKRRKRPSILFWHEGQLRALLGQTDAAVALFDAAREPPANDEIGWNIYVDGSIAFLKHDRAGLQKARDTLAKLPRPKGRGSGRFKAKQITLPWPPNLDVLDGFLKCFTRSYAEAYGSGACSVPNRR